MSLRPGSCALARTLELGAKPPAPQHPRKLGAAPAAPGLPPRRRAHLRCGKLALALVLDHATIYTPLRCKSWGCERCRKRISARWCDTLSRAEFRPRTFATLTIDPSYLERLCGCGRCRTADRNADCLLIDYTRQRAIFARHWKSLLQSLRREHGNAWRYFRCQEFHKGNYSPDWQLRNHRLHWHVLLELNLGGGRRDVDYSPARDRFAQLAARHHFGRTLAYTVDQTDADVRRYLAKYATKQPSSEHPHEFRIRVTSCSKSIRHQPTTADVHDFRIVRGSNNPDAPSLFDSLAIAWRTLHLAIRTDGADHRLRHVARLFDFLSRPADGDTIAAHFGARLAPRRRRDAPARRRRSLGSRPGDSRRAPEPDRDTPKAEAPRPNSGQLCHDTLSLTITHTP